MSNRLRFHLDESVDPDVAKGLRRYGIDVTTTVEAQLRTASDSEHWVYAHKERRVIVTHDADFLRMSAVDQTHFGVVFAHKTNRSVGEIIRGVVLVYEVLTVDEMRGKVEFI